MKTLAELKKEAKEGLLSLEMTEWYGETGDNIKEALRGVRKVIGANTVGLFLETPNYKSGKSELRLETASLVEYTGEELTIYNAGLRPLNEQEQAVMEEWKTIIATERYKTEYEYDMLTDGSGTFYEEQNFFSKKGFNYLRGFDTEKGCKLDHNSHMIRDNKVKGDVILRYRIYNTKELDKKQDQDQELEKD